jgi:betaine lipid synthase
MNEHIPLEFFDDIYLVDLCEPSLDVARKRFAKKGWHNVHILRQDANHFRLPGWTEGKDPPSSVGLVTLSYSLSMARTIVIIL